MEILEKYFGEFTPEQLRQFEALEGLYKEWNEKIGYADQDVLNLAYYGKVKFVSQRYNFMGKWRKNEDRKPIVIRHFASFSQKPWNYKLTRFTWLSYAYYLFYSSLS